ncbi:hypothetical protein DXG01_006752, partial [Tephrocybe rancida]
DVVQEGEYPVNAGGFADIYKGMFQGRVVCLKTFRLYQTDQIEHMLKATSKEAILWRQLLHPNVSTLFGLYRFRNRISLVTLWMENGDINVYLKKNPTAPRQRLAVDVGNGLTYLHENGVIHGDLKGPNILVDDAGRACLADFGISSISDSQIVAWTTQSSNSTHGGSTRWQAPELFAVGDSDMDDEEVEAAVKNTMASDVYALGCVFFEIFTGEVPFASITRDNTVILRVSSGARPARPLKSSPSWMEWGLTEDIWACIEDCWKGQPTERPPAATVVQRLAESITTADTRQGPHTDMLLPDEFRRRMSESFEIITVEDLNRILGTRLELTGQDVKNIIQQQPRQLPYTRILESDSSRRTPSQMPDYLSLLGILSPFNISGLNTENVVNAPLSRPSGNNPNDGSLAPNIPSSTDDLPLSVPSLGVHAGQQTNFAPVNDPDPAPVPPLTQPTSHPLPQTISPVLGGSAVRPETGDIAGRTTNPSVTFGKKPTKWRLGMFGTGKLHLPPLSGMTLPSSDSTPTLTHSQSSNTGGSSSQDPKTNQGVDSVLREAEKERRKLAEMKYREQARAITQRRQVMLQTSRKELEWPGGNERRPEFSETTKVSGEAGQYQSSTVDAAGRLFVAQGGGEEQDWPGAPVEQVPKSQLRREFDNMSFKSFATASSDPGPSRPPKRLNVYGINRMALVPSSRTPFDDFVSSAPTLNPLTLEEQPIAFNSYIGSDNPLPPPTTQQLPLLPTLSLSPETSQPQPAQNLIYPPFHYQNQLSRLGFTPKSNNSSLNPIFTMPPLPPQTADSDSKSSNALPPFSQLDAIAGGDPPFSPVSFVTTPADV